MAKQRIRIRLKAFDHQDPGPVGAADRRDGGAHRGGRRRPGAAAHPDREVHRHRGPVHRQGLPGAVRDAHPQAAHRRSGADSKTVDALMRLNASRRRRHRDQAVMDPWHFVGRKLGMTQVFDGRTGHGRRHRRPRSSPDTVHPPAHAGARRLHGRAARLRASAAPDQARAGPAQGPAAGRDDPRVPRRRPRTSYDGRRADRHVATLFAEGELVDVTGTSKGKGFAGVVKRHNFRGGPKTHGSDR